MHFDSVSAVPMQVEDGITRFSFEVLEGVVPDVGVGSLMVENGRIPVLIVCHNEVGKIVELFVGERAKSETSEALSDVQGDGASIGCEDALATAGDMDGLVIDVHSIHFPLGGGVDGVALSKQSTLVHDDSCRAKVGFNNTSDGCDGNVVDLMVVDALNGHRSVNSIDDTDIGTSDAAVSTTVHERLNRLASVALAHNVGG